jgi:hypothetical protein
MRGENYTRVIREWCATTGMLAWGDSDDKHVEIDDAVVALVPGGNNEPDCLHVLIDLGHYDFPDLERSLLEHNVPLDSPGHGCFGIHPTTGSVVYRVMLNLESDTDGHFLPHHISQLIQNARALLATSFILY